MGSKDIEALWEDIAAIHGDFAASSIRNSLSQAASANAPDELKELLQELSITLGKMSTALPKAEVRRFAKGLDIIIEEVVQHIDNLGTRRVSKMDILETDRLVLRTWYLDDAEALFKIYSNPELYRFTSSDPFPDVETTRRYMEEYFINRQKEYGFGVWAVVEKASGKIVGTCGLDYFDGRPELGLGYWFDPEYWGRGYATEAAQMCVEYAFNTINVPELASMTDPQNKASQRVLEKAGFVYVGMVPDDDGTDGMLYVARKPG